LGPSPFVPPTDPSTNEKAGNVSTNEKAGIFTPTHENVAIFGYIPISGGEIQKYLIF